MGDDVSTGNVAQGVNLDQDLVHVVGLVNLGSCGVLFRGASSNLDEYFLLSVQKLVKVNKLLVDMKTSLLGLLLPLLAVSVSLEPDDLGLLGVQLDDLVNSLAAVEELDDFLDLSSHGGSDHGHGEGCVLGGSQSSEFEDSASVGEGTGSVSVSVLLVDIVAEGVDKVSEVLDNGWLLSVKNVAQGRSEED